MNSKKGKITTKPMDNYSEKVNALGLTDSKSNYIKSLWKEHCRDIEGLHFMEDEGDQDEEDLIEAEPSMQQDQDYLPSIIETINTEAENLNLAEQQRWLEQKLTFLARLKSQIELRLRNISSTHEDNQVQ